MIKTRIFSIFLIAGSFVLGAWVYNSQNPESAWGNNPFKLGLDLSGGSHLVYKAKTDTLAEGDISPAMNSLREVIERRINLFGVSEPIVQVEEGGLLNNNNRDQRLIVEIPGVSDVDEAIKQIGATPLLEFKVLTTAKQEEYSKALASSTASTTIDINQYFATTNLTGQFLKKSQVELAGPLNKPAIGLTFNEEGADLFEKITKENIGNMIAIFLDGRVISSPTVREAIKGGKAQISGDFSRKEAQELSRNLNYGALPIPIELVSTQSIEASLGQEAIDKSLYAGFWTFLAIAIFLLVFYRASGFVAIIALAIYTVLNLAVFKFIPVTLTAAGIAAFILSLGMAVDANILIFERMKEELRAGKDLEESIREGFHRAWNSIRDSNTSSIITAIILFFTSSTPVVKGFALVFGIGVIISMFTAITASRMMMTSIGSKRKGKIINLLFGSLINNK